MKVIYVILLTTTACSTLILSTIASRLPGEPLIRAR